MSRLYDQLSNQVPVLRHNAIRQFIKFAIVGVSNTVIDFSLYLMFTRWLGLYFLLANAFSFILAASWSYIINKRWTFRDSSQRTVRQFFTFMIVSVVGLGLNEAAVSLAVYVFHLHDVTAKLIAVVVVVFWNFLANRTWTFTEHYGRVARTG